MLVDAWRTARGTRRRRHAQHELRAGEAGKDNELTLVEGEVVVGLFDAALEVEELVQDEAIGLSGTRRVSMRCGQQA